MTPLFSAVIRGSSANPNTESKIGWMLLLLGDRIRDCSIADERSGCGRGAWWAYAAALWHLAVVDVVLAIAAHGMCTE